MAEPGPAHAKPRRRRTWKPLIRQRLWFPSSEPRLSRPREWSWWKNRRRRDEGEG